MRALPPNPCASRTLAPAPLTSTCSGTASAHAADRQRPHQVAQRAHAERADPLVGERARPRLAAVEAALEVAGMRIRADRRELGAALRGMADQVVHAGAQPAQPAAVVRLALAGREAERVRVEAVEQRHARGLQRARQRGEEAARARHAGRAQRRLVGAHREDRQAVVAREPRVDRAQRRQQRGSHVRVEVGHVDPGRQRALDLRAQLDLHVLGLGALERLAGRAQEASRRPPPARAPRAAPATGPHR